MVDGAPKIAELAVDPHNDLIQMPAPLRTAAHMRHASLADLGREHWTKPVPPEPDGLMTDVDSALGQQILDVAQRQRISHVHHYDQTDDLWRAVEISERVAHGLKLIQPKTVRKIALTTPGAHRRSRRIPRSRSVFRDGQAALASLVQNASRSWTERSKPTELSAPICSVRTFPATWNSRGWTGIRIWSGRICRRFRSTRAPPASCEAEGSNPGSSARTVFRKPCSETRRLGRSWKLASAKHDALRNRPIQLSAMLPEWIVGQMASTRSDSAARRRSGSVLPL